MRRHRRQVIAMILRDAGYLLIVGVVAGTGLSLLAGGQLGPVRTKAL